MRDLRTTIVGAFLILTGIALGLFGEGEHKAMGGVVVTTGLGFLFAKDSGNRNGNDNGNMPPRQDPPKDS